MPRRQALGLVLLVAVSACSSDNTYLPALLDDPMASYQADGLVLIESWEQPEKASGFMGKPVHAEVGRSYRIEDQSQAEQILAVAAEYARVEGWRLAPPRTLPPTGYRGAKELPPGDGRLVVSLGPEDPLHDPGGPRILRIFLDFGPVRFDDTTTTTAKG